MTKYGSWDGPAGYPGSTPPGPPWSSHHPGYTSPLPHAASALYCCRTGMSGRVNMAVGLKSVDRLSLDVHISGSRGITEGYNLENIGRINNH